MDNLEKNSENARQPRPLISLRTAFGVLFFLLMIGTILLSFLINTIFLERYYISGRKHALIKVYHELQDAEFVITHSVTPVVSGFITRRPIYDIYYKYAEQSFTADSVS